MSRARPNVACITTTYYPTILVAIGGGVEPYGFHGMEVLQSLAEQRSGGETGVASIEPFEGRAVRDAADRGEWPEELLGGALEHGRTELPGSPRERVDVPTLFAVHYGRHEEIRTELEDYLDDWLYACRTGSGAPVSGRGTATRVGGHRTGTSTT